MHLHERRKKKFIDPQFQTIFIMKFCGLIILTSMVTIVLVYFLNRGTSTVAFENLRVVVKSTADFILPIMLQVVMIVTLLVGSATIAMTLFASHKIAGPLYRLKVEVDKMCTKDFATQVHVRDNDQLKSFVEVIERLRSEINNDMRCLQAEWQAVRPYCERLLESIADEHERAQVQEHIKKIEIIVNAYTTA